MLENIFLIKEIAKDPQKQNYQEEVAKNYIVTNYPEFTNFEILPKKSKSQLESIYLVNGQLVKESELSTTNHTKSIDFSWQYKEYFIYATHKYIKEFGGGQDNQFADVKNFLKHARQNTNNKNLFVAIYDGEYFIERNRFVQLKEFVKNTNCIVSTIYSLKENLDNFINEKKSL